MSLNGPFPPLHSPQVISLKKCGISDDPADYYLVDVQESDKEERELLPDENPYNIAPKSHGILRLYIRCATCDCVYIDMHAEWHPSGRSTEFTSTVYLNGPIRLLKEQA